VLGTLPESLIQALMLPDWSEHVTLLPDGRVPLTDEARKQLAKRGVATEDTPVTAIEGAGTTVEALRLADGRSLDADVVYTLSTTRPASPLAGQLGCSTEAGPFGPVVTTDEWCQTNIPGVYAAGDTARIFQTATLALADGVTAAVGAHHAMVLG